MSRPDDAQPNALIPQPHGGALKPPFPKGNGLAAKGGSWKAIRRAAVQRLSEATPECIDETIRMALHDPDSRVRTVNIQQILDRTLGKAGDASQCDAETGGGLDLSTKTPEQRARIHAALMVIAEETGRGGE
jgi:hypothetical protein